MSNLFAILNLPESLTLEPSEVEAAWQERTRKDRPDLSGDDSSPGDGSDLHRARTVLSDPVERLAHWLERKGIEWERGTTIEPSLMDLFSRLHEILGKADAVIAKHRSATTALTRAMLTKEAVSAQLAVQQCLQEVTAKKAEQTDQFAEFEDKASQGDFSAAVAGLAQLKFLRKWEQQCQDRLLALIEF